MRRSAVGLFVLALVAAAVLGDVLAPSAREVALMRLEDADTRGALTAYAELRASGDTSINVIPPLVRLHESEGDMESAIAVWRQFVADRPGSAEALRELARLYRASQRPHAYARALEELQALEPSAATLRELAEIYRFLGLYSKEAEALRGLVETPGARTREEDYARLASHLRLKDDGARAVDVLRMWIERSSYRVSRELLLLALDLLLEQERDTEAIALAQRCLQQNGTRDDAIDLAQAFLRWGRPESGLAILEPFASEPASPELVEQLAAAHLARRDEAAMDALLRHHFAAGTLPDSLLELLIDRALRRGDADLVQTVVRTSPPGAIPDRVHLHLAQRALLERQPRLAGVLQERLGRSHLAQRPLLRAILALAVGEPDGLAQLEAVSPGDLTRSQKLLAAGVCLDHARWTCAWTLLEGVPIEVVSDAIGGWSLAQLYLQTGHVHQGLEALQATRGPAWLLLSAATGQRDAVHTWLDAHPSPSLALLEQARDLAAAQGQPEAALDLAERIHAREPSTARALRVAELLAACERYPDALTSLAPLFDENPQARESYLYLLALAARAGTVTQAHLDVALRRSLAPHEKRDLAFALQEAGHRATAESLYIDLADEDGGIADLLGFWGDRPSQYGLEWLEARVLVAAPAQQAALFRYLNDTGHSRHVIRVAEATRLADAPRQEYVRALVATQDAQRLTPLLEEDIRTASGLGRIREAARLADDAGLPRVAELGWRRVRTHDPADPEALRQLGLLAFADRRYREAEDLLARFLAAEQEDYRAHYAYAELLLRSPAESDRATRHFERALARLSAIENRDPYLERDRAHLLFRNGRVDESVALYRRLLTQRPSDRSLRADFAEVLLETKRYQEVSQLLER